MSPQLQLVQQERRFYFVGRTKREILFTVLADSLDEARQQFRYAGHPASDPSSSSKPKPKSTSRNPGYRKDTQPKSYASARLHRLRLIFMYRTLGATILLAATTCISAAAQNTPPASNNFRWLDARKDAVLFDQIKGAFGDELKPDDPEKVKPVEAQLYKRIARIGVIHSSALVLIAERDTPTYTYGDYFQPFNYEINTGKKEPLEKGFMRWRFRRFAHFSTPETPDIVFTYLSCIECEATYLLGSFRFDTARRVWETRTWTSKEGGDAIMIGSDTVVGSEEGEYDYECLFKIADLDGDGLDDVAVRCQTVGEKGKIIDDTTLLYSIQHEKPTIVTLTEPERIAALTAKLCDSARKSRICATK